MDTRSPEPARGGSGSRPRWAGAGLALAAFGIALRAHNAVDYPFDKGFDAAAKWEYVALLMQRFALPAPDALWASAHPPLFYALAAGIGRALGSPEKAAVVTAVRLVGSALGLLVVGLAFAAVRRWDPGNERRAFLAAGLLLLLPVHVYTSAMLSEELLVAALVSLCVFGVARDAGGEAPRASFARPALWGALGGLALLAKASGGLALAAGGLAYLVGGARRGELRGGAARALVFGGVGAAVGGWFYLRNWIGWGYLYPQGLEVHAIMRSMPPGERGLVDYLYVPAATWLEPYALHPDLLRSVWGSTYLSLWFDPHRHFLPREAAGLTEVARAMAWLGILPTAGFAWGVVRGVRRALRSPRGPDTALLALLALGLGGYAAFTWRNPQFATLKASYLLGLSIPFAWFASDGLALWTRPGRWFAAPVWLALAALAALSAGLFWHGLLYAKLDDPGVQWLLLTPPPG